MIVAYTVAESWAIIGIAVVTVILFWKLIDLTVDAATQLWRDADAEGVEDLTANKERER